MIKKLLLITLLGVFLLGGAVMAQDNYLPDPGMLPDSPFYFLKSFFEGIGTFFTFGDIPRAERFLHLTEVRLAEAKALAEKGKSELAERTVERHQEQLDRALAKTEQAKAKGLDTDEVLVKVSEATLRHQAVLIDIYENVPEQARPAIERAMEAGMRGHEEALKAVSEEKQKEVRQQMEQKKEEVEQKAVEARERGVPVPAIPEILEEDETTDWQTYRNEEYGYEIRYPKNYILKETLNVEGVPTGGVLLREDEAEETNWIIEIFIAGDITDKLYNTSKMSFEEFAIDRIKAACAANGIVGSTYCTDVVKQKSFINKNKIEGYEIYITEVKKRYEENIEKTSERIKGPIFAFDISQQNHRKARGLFFQLTWRGEKEQEINERILRRIVENLYYWETPGEEIEVPEEIKEVEEAVEPTEEETPPSEKELPKELEKGEIIAGDARIKSIMRQFVTAAEFYSMKKGDYTYTGLSCEADENMVAICNDIQKDAGAKPTIHASKYNYCAYIKLLSKDQYYCVSTAKSGETVTNPSGLGYCDGITFTCPPVE